MAGGTGGHVFPGLAVARRLYERGVEILWLGSRTGLERELVPAQGFAFEAVDIKGLRGKGIGAWLAAPWQLSFAFWRVLSIFWKKRPALVLGMGGFVAGPGGVAAFVANIPLLIHEQNAIAGLTNRLLAPLSRRVLTGFPNVLDSKRTVYVGNPVRRSFAPAPQAHGDDGGLHLLVVGGSRGADIFNRTVPQALALMDADRRPQVRQQCGHGRAQAVRAAAASAGVEMQCFDFDERMEELYRWADVVLCRAGAMTIAELAAVGRASILVPFPHAVGDHQTANARFLSGGGGAILLPQDEFNPGSLAQLLGGLARERGRLRQMAQRACELAVRDSDARIAQICCQEGGL